MNQEKPSSPHTYLDRREFLHSLGVITTRLAFGGFLKNFKPHSLEKHSRGISRHKEGSPRLREVPIPTKETSANGLNTILFADHLCLYTDVQPTNEDGGINPTDNNRFYHNRRHELLGFTDSPPPFLIIHTAGGNITSAINYLNQRKIHCQFYAGMLDNKPTSIQSTLLQSNRVNLSGTTSGAPMNPFEANLQFWQSINIEIEGHPNQVDQRLVKKVVDLCINIMQVYNLKISQVIGHIEVPNNGKPDPGRTFLRKLRTEIYKTLLRHKKYHLIDIWPQNTKLLKEHFAIGNEAIGPAQLSQDGRTKCWLVDIDSFADWIKIEEYISLYPGLKNDIDKYRTGEIVLDPRKQKTNVEFSEIYMGFPPGFANWLFAKYKPLYDNEFRIYSPNALANFIQSSLQMIHQTNDLKGKKLKLSYNTIQNLARLFINTKPYENRGSDLSEAIIAFTLNQNKIENWQVINNHYTRTFGENIF